MTLGSASHCELVMSGASVKTHYLLGLTSTCLSLMYITHAGSILVACWLQPFDDIRPEDVWQELDDVAQQVARELLKQHSTGATSSPKVRHNQQEDGMTVTQSHRPLATVLELQLPRSEVLEAINAVLYEQLGFTPALADNYYKLDNSLINKVRVESTIPLPPTVIAV